MTAGSGPTKTVPSRSISVNRAISTIGSPRCTVEFAHRMAGSPRSTIASRVKGRALIVWVT
jgi:hypothetical protein